MTGHHVLRITTVGCIGLMACLAQPVAAQQRALTLDAIFDPQRRVDFDGNPPRGLVWLDDDHYLQRADQPGTESAPLLKVNATTGARESLFDAQVMQRALTAYPGMSEDDARQISRRGDHLLNETQTALVFELANDLYHYSLDALQLSRLTWSAGREEEVSFSPDGRFVAFVRERNLYVVDVAAGRERPMTSDGGDTIRNGLLDWVYQEEIYGRDNFRGYWWSPESSRLAYLRLDDSNVPTFTVLDHIPYHPEVEHWDYPKAGDQNPVATLGIVEAHGGETAWVDLVEYEPSQPLIVDVGWSPDGARVVFQVQNREQTWLDLNIATPAGHRTRLLRETSDAWVNVNGPPMWLEDGSFLWSSERTGWKHLYHHRADGRVARRITDGSWEVRSLHGIDETARWIYFSGTERSHIGSDVYRVRLDGSVITRLSEASGTHRVQFNPSLTRYLDTWSSITTPPSVRLHAANGAELRVVDVNIVAVLDDYHLADPEFLQVTNRDGFVMEAMMIKPPDFDPSRRYPVYQHVYGAPHVQRVTNAWAGSRYMYWQLLAQHGVIVWVMDNSTASGKGAVSTWPVYQNFGELELRDIEDGVAWLGEQPYVDTSRIGLEGWSYGGYMVTYALTHSRSFAMGIAGGSVTDWRDYDTIYTERYMRMPQNNPDGYDRSASRFAASDLSGALLLVHGTMDENVHLQNTLQFAYEIQKAGKSFDMMIYPRSRHRLGGLDLEKHHHNKMLEFVLQHLGTARAAGAATSVRR